MAEQKWREVVAVITKEIAARFATRMKASRSRLLCRYPFLWDVADESAIGTG